MYQRVSTAFFRCYHSETNDMIDDSVQVRDGTVGTPAFGSATGGLFAGVAPIFGGPTTSGQAGSLFGNLVTTPSGPGQLFESAVHTAFAYHGVCQYKQLLPITGSAVQTALPTTGSAVHTAFAYHGVCSTNSFAYHRVCSTHSWTGNVSPALLLHLVNSKHHHRLLCLRRICWMDLLGEQQLKAHKGMGFLRSLLAPRSRSPNTSSSKPVNTRVACH